MRKYYPEFHTAENLANQITEIYKLCPQILVVGSLGRATVFNTVRRNPYFEFIERRQHPLYAGNTARDIDVIGAEHEVVERTLPHWVDATSYDIGGTQVAQENGEWHLSVDGHCHATLHTAVMEAIEGETIYGIPCVTIPVETQLALLKVRGKFREKDVQTFSLLSDVIEIKGTSERLPAELFTDFDKVHEINARRFS